MENIFLKPNEDLNQFLNKTEILKQTIAQIKKDFESLGLSIKSPSIKSNVYHALSDQITPQINKLIDTNYQKLLNVLYRIDVNEQEIKKCINNSEVENIANEITRLIIFRELQKVVIRNYYKP